MAALGQELWQACFDGERTRTLSLLDEGTNISMRERLSLRQREAVVLRVHREHVVKRDAVQFLLFR